MSVAADRGVAVVIPVHNAAKTIVDQLEALSTQETAFPWEVVLVMNRCTDRTLEVMAPWLCSRSPKMNVVFANERAGASYARNAGVRTTQASVLVFCDADDVVESNWLNEMVAALDHADLVGGKMAPLPTTPPEILEMFPVYRSQQSFGLPTHGPLLYPMTASMSCRREVFDAAGGFDEGFVHGCDDVVFSLRAQQAGFRLGFAESASCGYRIRESIREVSAQRCSYTEGNIRYAKDVAPFLRRSEAFEWLMLLGLGARALLSFRPNRPSKWWIHFRVQRARVRALRRSGTISTRTNESTRALELSPTLLVDLGRSFPWLRRAGLVDRAVNRWTKAQALVDFTVPLAVPSIGGLGLMAPLDHANARAQERDFSGPLRLFNQSASVGDAVVDVGSGYGLFAVVASQRVGPDGRLLVIETRPALLRSVEGNLQRHAAKTPAVLANDLIIEKYPSAHIDATQPHEGSRAVSPQTSIEFIFMNDRDTVLRNRDAVSALLRMKRGAAVILPHWILADRRLATWLLRVLGEETRDATIWTTNQDDVASRAVLSEVGNFDELSLADLLSRIGPHSDALILPTHRSVLEETT